MVDVYQLPPSDERPDRWVLVKTDEGVRILSGRSGGYLGGDEWRFSTPIKETRDVDGCAWSARTGSGSIYHLSHKCYGTTDLSSSVFHSFKEQISDDRIFEMIAEEDTDAVLRSFLV